MTLQWLPDPKWIDDKRSMLKLIDKIRDTGECALDTETTGLDRRTDHIILWSLCPDENSRYCLSVDMLRLYSEELAPDPNIDWYFTNETYDLSMLANTGAALPVGDCYDTLAMDWLRDENRRGRHGLKETAWDYLGLSMRTFNQTFPKKHKTDSVTERIMRVFDADTDSAIDYASEDAWATFRVFHKIKSDLKGMTNSYGENLWEYFREFEAPFTMCLYNMCDIGVRVDTEYLEELSPPILEDKEKIQRRINKIYGGEINLSSPIQLRKLLFDNLGLKPLKKTSGGNSGNRQPSTDAQSLNYWASKGVEVAELILKHRSLVKVHSTYIIGLNKWADSEERVHATLTQHVTVSGRLSSVDPNLQNIPTSSSEDKYRLRSAFVPREGHIFIVADYEQLEMRLLAHMSGDRNMIDVINRGWDIHSGTASLMFSRTYEEIQAAIKKKKAAAKDSTITLSKDESLLCSYRAAAKAIGFGINYGEGDRALAEKLGISVQEAKDKKEQYFRPYPNVQRFIEHVHAEMARTGILETIMGRPRRFPEMLELGPIPYWQLTGHERKARARAERQGVNSVIQGSAADVAKFAMLKCEHDEDLADMRVRQLLQVHDEIIFEVPERHVEEALYVIQDDMEHPFEFDLSVPLAVDIGTGRSWLEAKA